MKMTIDLPEPLLREAKELAAREGRTLSDLVDEGLRKIIFKGGKEAAASNDDLDEE
jgi:hypothetical protein